MNAQISIASHVMGTMIALIINNQRILRGEINMKGNWMSQYSK